MKASQVTPIYYVLFTTFTIVASALLFNGWGADRRLVLNLTHAAPGSSDQLPDPSGTPVNRTCRRPRVMCIERACSVLRCVVLRRHVCDGHLRLHDHLLRRVPSPHQVRTALSKSHDISPVAHRRPMTHDRCCSREMADGHSLDDSLFSTWTTAAAKPEAFAMATIETDVDDANRDTDKLIRK